MKMKKLLLTCAAVAGVSAALATSSFAEVITNNDGYSKDAGTYSVKSDLTSQSGQMTVLIIPKAAYDAGTVQDSDIIYIDQTAAPSSDKIFQDLGLKGGKTLADGDYYIRIGGDNIDENGIIVEMFTVSSAGDTPSYYFGDVDLSGGYPDLADAKQIINYALWESSVFDLEDDNAALRLKLANISSDRDTVEDVDLADAKQIINYVLWEASTLDDLLPAE